MVYYVQENSAQRQDLESTKNCNWRGV